jgi:tetratricopeptide (TPR) repeat protein
VKEPFSKQAAKVCLVVPFFCGVMIIITKRAVQQHPFTSQFIPLICAALVVLAFFMGIVALPGMRKYGTRGIALPALIGLFLNGLIISIAIYSYFDTRNVNSFENNGVGKNEVSNLIEQRDDDYQIPNHRYHFIAEDQSYLIDDLKEAKFEFLNKKIESIYNSSYEDLMYEVEIDLALDVFERSDPALEKHFNAWVEQSPREWQPYLARGSYYFSCGWQERGNDWARNTADQQFRGMYHYLKKAKADFEYALTLKPGLVPAYTYLIRIAKTSLFNDQEARGLIDSAIASCPGIYSARMEYFRNLLPRWGGSIREMEDFLKETRGYYHLNKRLHMLEGRIEIELGDQKFQQKDFKKALRHYNLALEHGHDALYLHQRGRSLMMLDRVEEAITDFTRALQQRPYYELALEKRILCGGYRPDLIPGGIEQIMKDADRLIEMHPGDDKNMMRRAVVKYQQMDFQAALDDLKITLTMNPDNEGAKKLVAICRKCLEQQGYTAR